MAASRPAQAGNSRAGSDDCADLHETARFSRTHSSGGALCQFEQVRGRGEEEVLRLAALQHGHIHRIQLTAAGIGRGALTHRLRTGWLQIAHPSVYRIAGAGQERLGRRMAAALYFRGDALVGGADAAEMWQMLDSTQSLTADAPIDVVLVGRSFHPAPGIRVHRVKSLARQDVRWRNGIPVTSPARTVFDLARKAGDLELEAAAALAFRRSGLRVSQLRDVVDRNPHAKGVARVRALLDEPEALHDTRSKYERRLLRLLAAAELPTPVTNVKAAGHMVDMLWPELKLVVEFDSWDIHGRRGSFETDRIRDQDLAATAHQVLRVTARQVDHAPYALVARLATVMALRLGR